MTELPELNTLRLELRAGVLTVWLHRPAVRNAMSLEMVAELEQTVDVASKDKVRAMVVRGSQGQFCAGADLRDLAAARQKEPGPGEDDPVVSVSRAFGRMLTKIDRAPFAVIAVLEGAVMGGGLGLACVADVALAEAGARLRLPETRVGVPPAQLAPFLVRRVGRSEARRLAVTGGTLDARAAHQVGLVHEIADGAEALEACLQGVLNDVLAGAPGAIATTKALILDVGWVPDEALLDRGAQAFAAAVRSEEGQEGTLAFLQKRPPNWADEGNGT